jgi:two-component system, cell cycle sensor histidine kinase and response regulator CckA
VITVQLDALGEHLRNDPRARECLVPMEAASARAADLVRQLLTFGRRTPSDRQRLDLRVPVHETIELLRRTIGDSYRIDAAVADEPLPVAGDRSQISQIVLNLCLNARDAMQYGGVIGVRAARDPGDPEHRVLFEVSDRGSGIAPSDQEKVFEPFFTTKEAGRGTGLGLALVHEIVQRHGGTITVASEVGRGSCFRVSLPREEEGLEEPKAPVPAAPATVRRSARVLVVESDDEVRGVLRGFLEREAHRVSVARNPREAMALAEGSASGFEVLVTSPTLPELSGPELARRLAERGGRFATIYASGLARGGGKSIAGAEGVELPRGARVLSKPFSTAELREAIAGALEELRAGRVRGG